MPNNRITRRSLNHVYPLEIEDKENTKKESQIDEDKTDKDLKIADQM